MSETSVYKSSIFNFSNQRLKILTNFYRNFFVGLCEETEVFGTPEDTGSSLTKT